MDLIFEPKMLHRRIYDARSGLLRTENTGRMDKGERWAELGNEKEA